MFPTNHLTVKRPQALITFHFHTTSFGALLNRIRADVFFPHFRFHSNSTITKKINKKKPHTNHNSGKDPRPTAQNSTHTGDRVECKRSRPAARK